MRFADLTAPTLRALDRDLLVVAPIAACEQHADHLPVSTDSLLCAAVADRLEADLPDSVLLLPLLWLGASDHHLPFGGTLTAPLPTYEDLLVALARPLLLQGFRRLLFLNGHGGNIDPMHVALRRLDAEFPGRLLTGAAYWELAAPEIAALCSGPRKSVGHACEVETSLMLHLHPHLVQPDLARDDPADPPPGLDRLFWARDFAHRTRSGAVGYPRAASADTGRALLDAIARLTAATARALHALPLNTPRAHADS
jgi:creatinine amidohydrolase